MDDGVDEAALLAKMRARRAETRAWLEGREHVVLHFEGILEDPRAAAQVVARLEGLGDVRQMAAAVEG